MSDLVSAVRAALAVQHMLAGSAPVVVAVSGGPDSLALLHILHQLAPELGISLHVAHLDHQIRGAESAAESQFVAQLAQQWGLPATVAASDVPAQAAATRTNLHAAARAARYAFLAHVAQTIGAQAVAVAHHANDQAETVLLHLLRGAGPEGLSGMRPVQPWQAWAGGSMGAAALIRPLLGVERDAIEAYCATHKLAPRHDPSNFDLAATRNRIRHELLPLLIEYNPHVVAALGRTAALSAGEHEFVEAALDTVWPALAKLRAGAVDIAGAEWGLLAPALQRAALRRAHGRLAPGATLALQHVEQARALIGRGVGGQFDLPGGVALQVGYGGSFTLGAAPMLDGPQLAADSVALPEQGTVVLGAGWELRVSREQMPAPAGPWAVQLDVATLAGPLLLRRRAPADRLPLEAGGHRRVQDLLTDAKVPRALRDAWPLLVHAETVVWVPGVRAAGAFRAGPATRDTITLTLLRTNAG